MQKIGRRSMGPAGESRRIRRPTLAPLGCRRSTAERCGREPVVRCRDPRRWRLNGQLMIVIRGTIMGVAVKRNLDGQLMVMSARMVGVLMERNRQDRKAGHGPQQSANSSTSSESPAHGGGESHGT